MAKNVVFVEYSSLPFLSDGNCSNDELIQAIEGIFILRRRLLVNDDTMCLGGPSITVLKHILREPKSTAQQICLKILA